MDEIDSIGGARGESGKGDSEVQRTMLELLNQVIRTNKHRYKRFISNLY